MIVKEIIEAKFPFLTVRFKNGEILTFDVEKTLGHLQSEGAKYILDRNNFHKVQVKNFTATWDNGVGFDPDSMFEDWVRVGADTPSLDELLSGVPEGETFSEFDTGNSVGKEY